MSKIFRRSVIASLLLLVALGLTACGNSNLLIGKWEGKSTVAGMTQTSIIEFTAKEIIVRQTQMSIAGRPMNLGGSGETRTPIYYRVEGGKVLVSKDNAQWETVDMPDKNTIRFDMGFSVMTLKRK